MTNLAARGDRGCLGLKMDGISYALLHHGDLKIVRFKKRQKNQTNLHTNQVNPKDSAMALIRHAPQPTSANHSAIRSVVRVFQAIKSSFSYQQQKPRSALGRDALLNGLAEPALVPLVELEQHR